MDCDEFYEKIAEGEAHLDPETQRALDEHAATCDDCTRTRKGLRAFNATLKAEAGKPSSPIALSPELEKAVDAVMANRAKARARVFRQRAALSFVILVLLALSFVGGVAYQRQQPAPPAPPPVAPPAPPVTPPAPPVAPPPPPEPIQEVHLSGGGDVDLLAAKILFDRGYVEQAQPLAKKALDRGKLTDNEKKLALEILSR